MWIAIGYVMFFVVRFYVVNGAFGGDAHAYWLTAHRSALYVRAPTEKDAYLYSPAFAQIIWPIAVLPWPAYFAIWTTLEAIALAWLLWPLGWKLGVPVAMLCAAEFVLGEVNLFLAVAAVVGMSRAQAWAFPLLTKVTPGLGPLWFLVRREWRPFFLAAATTLAIVAVSFAADWHAWFDWIHFLRSHHGKGTLFFPLRALLALLLTVSAARVNRPALLPAAMLIAAPVIHNAAVLTVLVAIPRMRRTSISTARRP